MGRQKSRPLAWIQMIVDQLRSCIGSPEMKESEDPHLLAWFCTWVRSQRKRARWENVGWSGPTFPLQAREEGDDWGPESCQETRVGWPEPPEKILQTGWAANSWSRQGAHLRVLMTPGGPETGWAPTGPQLCGFHLPPAIRVGGWWGTTSPTTR